MAFYQRHAVENTTRSRVLNVNGKKPPRDVKPLELLEDTDIRIVVV